MITVTVQNHNHFATLTFPCSEKEMEKGLEELDRWDETNFTLFETKWLVEAVKKAQETRKASRPLIMHSDRGRQYTSKEYADAAWGITLSYSKKAYPWDNACIESFHALLKREWINRFKITDYKHAYKLIFEYIEAFYNTVRIHSHCDYTSPNDHEKNYWKTLRHLEIGAA